MTKYKYLYELYFKETRQKFTKKNLKDSTITKRINKILARLSIQDRYYLQLLDMYKISIRVAAMAEVSVRRASERINIAVSKLVTPTNLEYVTGVELFKHTGEALSATKYFTTRTLNAMKKNNITTLDDLYCWLKIDIRNVYRIPGVGRVGQAQLLLCYSKGVLEK